MKLKTVRAKRCRGILDGPDLPLGSGGLLLCGSNGTGKSSFIDALEFALTGKCSSLDTGDRGLSWGTHGTHVAGDGSPEVELIFDMGGSEHIWTRGGTATPPAKVKAFIDAAEGETFILRRRAILDFIDAKPAERYKALEGFFRLDRYCAFEAKLKALASEIQQRLKAAQTEQLSQESSLRLAGALPATAPVNLAACISLVNTSLETTSFAPIADLDALPVRIQEVHAALKQFQNMDVVLNLKNVLGLLQNLPNLSQTIEAGRAYLDLVVKCADEESKIKGHFLDEVLKQGLTWIEVDGLACCPLCENPISDVKQLAEQVRQRLDLHAGLTRLRGQREQAATQFNKLVGTVVTEWTKLAQQWKGALAEDLPAETSTRLSTLTTIAGQSVANAGQLTATLEVMAEMDLETTRAVLSAHVQQRAQSFPDYAEYQRLGRANSVLTAVSAFLQFSNVNAKTIAHFETCANTSKALASHAEAARKTAVQRTVEAITNQADRYFGEIHPGESIGKPALIVTRGGAGSLQLKSEFYGRESDPRGYYSEGHVDSLGLCLFLALRRLHHHRSPEFALLVLDDVLHSVDGEHRRATADLIFREFGDHQIVVTTHDLLWFEQLKRAARQHVAGRKFEERRIGTWSITEGPVWGDHLSDREWLASPTADRALPADRVIKVGRMLEELLKQLCHNLTIPVRFDMSGRYTLDPLWTAFTSKAAEHKEFSTAAQDVMPTLRAHIAARNAVGGHYNEWAQGFTAEEAKVFSDAALHLHALSFCPDCNGFIKRIADLEGVWSCKGEHLKYRKKPPAATPV